MRLLLNDIHLPALGLPAGRRPDIPAEILGDVRAFLADRHAQTDRWFFMVRMTLGLLLVGYLTIDAVNPAGVGPSKMLLVLGYLLANLAVWFLGGGPGFTFARWIYAGLDFAFLLAPRHLFHFEALVDPNATMVGLFTLLLIAYTVYSDPLLSRALAAATLAATVLTVGLDVARDAAEASWLYRSYPLRVILLLSYLGSFCLVTTLLARRLRQQVLNYGVELQKRMHASMTTAVERTRREKLEELNRLKHNFIAVLSHELRTPIAPLRSSLEIVRSEMGPEAERHELLNIALESASKLQRLVQDYTQLAELLTTEHNGLLRWNIRVAALVEVLREGMEQHLVETDGLDDLVVSADPRLLGGALLALMRRADLVTSPEAPVTVRGYADGASVVLSVHDPESYLEPDVVQSLDDPFLSSSERTFFSPNTGIELVLAQHSIQRLGGKLRIDSDRGHGTTVYCILPGRQYGIQWLNDAQIRHELEAAFGL